MQEPTTTYKCKFMTAKEMALTSHNLSSDGTCATLANGDVYKWSDHFKTWAGPFPPTGRTAKPPRAKTK